MGVVVVLWLWQAPVSLYGGKHHPRLLSPVPGEHTIEAVALAVLHNHTIQWKNMYLSSRYTYLMSQSLNHL